MKMTLVLLLLGSPLLAAAQAVVQSPVAKLQSQIGRDGTGYTTCGMRVVALDVRPDVVDAYDFSLYVRADMLEGTVKAGKMQSSTADFTAGRGGAVAVLPGPRSFWIARASEGEALVATNVMPADSPGYLLGLADFAGTWTSLLALTAGEPMQFAVRYADQGYDTVVGFTATLAPEEVKPLRACFDGLLKRMKKALKSK